MVRERERERERMRAGGVHDGFCYWQHGTSEESKKQAENTVRVRPSIGSLTLSPSPMRRSPC